jgi:hypothetical protein
MGATENVSRFSLYLFSQVHNHNINKSNRYFKLNVYYNDIDIQCLVTVHALAITPCGQRLPSRPLVGACHHAPWVGAFHRTRGQRLPSRPVGQRLPSHPLWSACRHAPWSAYHRTPCGPLAIAPPRGPLAIVPPVVHACHHARGSALAIAPPMVRLPSCAPWSACHRARGPLAIAPVVRLPSRPAAIAPCGRQNSSHTEDHRTRPERG